MKPISIKVAIPTCEGGTSLTREITRVQYIIGQKSLFGQTLSIDVKCEYPKAHIHE